MLFRLLCPFCFCVFWIRKTLREACGQTIFIVRPKVMLNEDVDTFSCFIGIQLEFLSHYHITLAPTSVGDASCISDTLNYIAHRVIYWCVCVFVCLCVV